MRRRQLRLNSRSLRVFAAARILRGGAPDGNRRAVGGRRASRRPRADPPRRQGRPGENGSGRLRRSDGGQRFCSSTHRGKRDRHNGRRRRLCRSIGSRIARRPRFTRWAARFAVAAAHVSVTRYGAQASYPDRAEVEKMLARLPSEEILNPQPDLMDNFCKRLQVTGG